MEYDRLPDTYYMLSEDFSNTDNPNGPWALRSGTTNLIWNTTQNRWAMAEPYHLPMCQQTTSTNDYNGHVNYIAGDVVCHSTDAVNGSVNGDFNAAWTAPYNGVIDIEGCIWYAHSQETGRGDDWTLSLEATDLAAGTVYFGQSDRDNPSSFASGLIAGQSLDDLAVNRGDIVRLEVAKRAGDVFGSFAGFDIIVGYDSYRFDLSDFAEMAMTWQCSQGDAAYDDVWDFVDDDMIDINDLSVFLESWL